MLLMVLWIRVEVIRGPNWFQVLQPIGGVRARVLGWGWVGEKEVGEEEGEDEDVFRP